jgi:glycosyltransferase involved in cell wall biosynthesis
MRITVAIPTYRRSKDLARCINALDRQIQLPDELIVIVRDSDVETWSFLENLTLDLLLISTVTVFEQGVIAAMNAALDVAQGDIIAFTDDDAEPHEDWIARIRKHFANDKSLGGLGGRDYLYSQGCFFEGQQETVGKLQWYGLVVGNHHLGFGNPREVDILKGVNMSFRKEAIKGMYFDNRMRGAGAQVHFEVMWCLTLKKKGWKLIYDPAVAVNHYWAKRFDEDQRFKFNPLAEINKSHNETLALLQHLPQIQRAVFMVWALIIGTRANYGIVQWLRFLPKEGNLSSRKLITSLQGRLEGWKTWQQSQL